MSIVIGCDPGVGGAIVVLDGDLVLDFTPMPSAKVGAKSRVNAPAVADFLLKHVGARMAFVERVGAMPNQGTSSMFSFGHSAGVLHGVLAALGIPMGLVTPVAWKKRAGLINQDKDAARGLALQLWPQWRALDQKIKGQALADAALIAYYGREVKTDE